MRASDAWKQWTAPASPENPDAPSLGWIYQPPKRALLIRAQYAEIPPGGKAAWTDSAGVRGVDVLGLDAKPADATRALVEFREGKTFRQVWVCLDVLASTPAAAAEKLATHFSALLVAQRLAKKPVTTTAGSAEASSSSSAENGAERSTTEPAPSTNAGTDAAPAASPETTLRDPNVENDAGRGWAAGHEGRQEAAA